VSQPDDLLDPFLRETEGADVLPAIAAQVTGLRPSAGLRARILEAATGEGRFERFAAVTAELLDLPVAGAQALLDRLSDPGIWSPGLVPSMTLCHVQGGPRVKGAITGFVRIASGSGFPDHEHLGDEEVLIIQGSCIDSIGGKLFAPGDRVAMPSGSIHSFDVRPGPDLVYLAVVFGGIRVGGQELLADDPRL
jgi:quercetin dioxygenase-like cupin family protein